MDTSRESPEEKLRRKQQYFDDLDNVLKSDDDETSDPGRKASLLTLQKASSRKQISNPTKGRTGNGLPRSISDSSIQHKSNKKDFESVRPITSDGTSKQPASLQARRTFPDAATKSMTAAIPSSAVPRLTGKRKRSGVETLKLLPTEQQIFNGLDFYFFPNDDKHPARRMRITKALEYGATWQKDFNKSVTHVIVDKAMEYSLVLKFLKSKKVDTIPEHVIVTSENWPAECISHRSLLPAKGRQFRVKGYEISETTNSSKPVSDQSLELKRAGKSVMARQPETPPAERANTPTTASPEHEVEDDIELKQLGKTADARAHTTDELEAAIKQARLLQDIPLDDDEEGSRPSSSSSSEGPSDFTVLQPSKKSTKYSTFQSKFQCMQPHGSTPENPNSTTISILQQMADYYGAIGDEWRLRAYRKAMSTLKNHPTKVWTKEEALALPQIGERLATKIEEIAYTSRLRRLDNAKAEPNDQTLKLFMGIYGVGYAQASKWVDQGYTTLDELVAKADLTENQKIGIDHYADFQTRIPRAEVEQHGLMVRKTLQKIDPKFEVIIGGSYRRGAKDSGDIDCIITRPETGLAHIRKVVLDQLVPKLFEMGFLVAELAATSRDSGSKWHSACTIPSTTASHKPTKALSAPFKPPRSGTTAPKTHVQVAEMHPWRRIDLLLVPSAELGAALLYFTGDDIFNRSMRLLASTKGMRLNQRGLYRDVIRGKGREKLSEGTLVEGKDERKIFEVLGVPWREAEQRIC